MRRTSLIALIAAPLLSLGLASPAVAESAGFPDADDQPAGLHDIRSVRVHHTGDQLIVNTKVDNLRRDYPGGMQVFVDTDRRRNGPERVFSTGIYRGTDYSLWRMRDWRYQGNTPLECDYSVNLRFGKDLVHVEMDRGCLGSPRKARIAVKAQDEQVDWLRGPRHFTPWLLAG